MSEYIKTGMEIFDEIEDKGGHQLCEKKWVSVEWMRKTIELGEKSVPMGELCYWLLSTLES